MEVLVLDNENDIYDSLTQDNKFKTSIVNELDSLIEMLAQNNYDLIIYDANSKIVDVKVIHYLSMAIKNEPYLCIVSKDSHLEQTKSFTCFNDISELYKFIQEFQKGHEFDFNCRTHTVLFNNSEIKLTCIEAKILELFLTNANEVLSKSDIENYVWGEGVMKVKNTLATHLTNLKNKLSPFRENLVNIRGQGYLFKK